MNIGTKHWLRGFAINCLTGALLLHATASDCTRTSVGLTPINDLGTGNYLNQFQGGLYPGGLNQMPPQHAREGRARALSVRPLDVNGNPNPNGKYVFLSIGMSNASMEFTTFMSLADAHPHVEHNQMVMINGARGGQDAETWDQPSDPNYDIIQEMLTSRGLSERQVQALWVKMANREVNPPLPNPDAEAYRLLRQLGDIVRSVKTRYPNVKVVFISSRSYAGYTSTNLSREPYPYESGFAVKWLIEAQITQMATGIIDPRAGNLNYHTVAPWVCWGSYLWADGLNVRSDGLFWQCSDFANDGIHPSPPGRLKVGRMLLSHWLTSPFSRTWFSTYPIGDVNLDGCVDDSDLLGVLFRFGESGVSLAPDLNGDGIVEDGDLLTVLFSFGQGCR